MPLPMPIGRPDLPSKPKGGKTDIPTTSLINPKTVNIPSTDESINVGSIGAESIVNDKDTKRTPFSKEGAEEIHEINPEDAANEKAMRDLDKQSAGKPILKTIFKIGLTTTGLGFVYKLADMIFGGSDGKQSVQPNPLVRPDGSVVEGTDKQEDPDGAIRAKLLKNIMNTGTIPVDETYKNMKREYNQYFKMNRDEVNQMINKSSSEMVAKANAIYDNTVTTFFDKIRQGFGLSNGQASSEALKSNQKLRSDVASLMEYSSMLVTSMTMPDGPAKFKMRANAARGILDTVTPGTWDKIAENAIKAAAGITSILMHNQNIAKENAMLAYQSLSSKAKESGTDMSGVLGAMEKLIKTSADTRSSEPVAKYAFDTAKMLFEHASKNMGITKEFPK